MKERETKEVDVIIRIFNPSPGKDLKIDYPELASIEEFKNMEPNEVKFCWYMGNRTSPFFNLDRDKKLEKTLKTLFPKGKKPSKWQEIENGEFPSHILKGISRMTLFNAENRLKAMLLSDYSFSQLEKLVYVSDEELKEMDVEERKKYADLLIKVQSELPKMVKNNEEGYGVRVEEQKTGNRILVDIKSLG